MFVANDGSPLNSATQECEICKAPHIFPVSIYEEWLRKYPKSKKQRARWLAIVERHERGEQG